MTRFCTTAFTDVMTGEGTDAVPFCLDRDSRIPHSAEPWGKTQQMMVR